MITIKEIKSYVSYIAICIIFFITVTAGAIIYYKYYEITVNKVQLDPGALDVKLPVIEWGKYENLSKKYTDDRLKK